MNECSCVYVDAGDCAGTMHSEIRRKARKQHICIECRRTIKINEMYEYAKGLYDGQWYEFKTCADCLSIRDSFFCESFLYSEMLSHLREHIQDMNGNISSDCITPLTERAKDMVCIMIQQMFDETREKTI